MSAPPAPPPRTNTVLASPAVPCSLPRGDEGDDHVGPLLDHDLAADDTDELDEDDPGEEPPDADNEADDEDNDQADERDEAAEPPRLEQDVVDDSDALATTVDAVAVSDPTARQHQARLRGLYDQLHRNLAPVDFAVVLRVEEVHNARTADLLVVVARWGWEEGRRVGREEG